MSTYTTSNTFTKTHAEYLASKIAADLKQMQYFYGQPSDAKIRQYIEEAVILLLYGYLDSVDYGFEKNNKWVVAVSYEVDNTSGTLQDNNAGRIPVGAYIQGARWCSYLRWKNIDPAERRRIESVLPFSRSGSADPQGDISGSYDKSYFSGNVGLKRKTFS